MKVLFKNEEIEAKVLGGFKIEQLNKEYAICSFDADKNSDKAYIIITEIDRSNDIPTLISIPKEEEQLVVTFYNEFKKNILKED